MTRDSQALLAVEARHARFGDRIYLVNPRGGMIEGTMPIYKSVLDIPDDVELAVVNTPPATVPAQDREQYLWWLDNGFHGEMRYMERHGRRRSRPAELVPGTVRVISVRMPATAPDAAPAGRIR